MARLSYEERINRLQDRYNELVKPVFIIAESQGESVATVTILSNGKKSEQVFETRTAFLAYVEHFQNCNVIADDKIMQFREEELVKAVGKASKEDLDAIANDEATPDIISRVLHRGIVSQIRV